MTRRAGEASGRSWRRLVPIASWLPRYDRQLLAGDIAAGVAVTAMIVPMDLGYAGIAEVPIQDGLYAAPSIDVMTDYLSEIGIASVALLLIGFSQTAGDAGAFAARHRSAST